MKKFLFALACLLPFVLVLGCNPPGGANPVTAAQAKTAAQTVVNGVTAVMNGTWSESVSGTSATVSFSGTGSSTGVSMNGTLTGVGSNPETFILTITFSNYVDTSGYKANGSVTLSMTMNTLTNAVSVALTGNLTFSGGPVTTATCNMTATGTVGSGSTNLVIVGTFTVNGTSFDVSTLGLQTSINSPYTTIAWQPDGTGWTQFETNDPSTMGNGYTHIIPGSTMTTGGTVKIGIIQNSGSDQVGLGITFGYVSANNYWVFYIDQFTSGHYDVYKWNGLSWQYIVGYFGGTGGVPIVLGAGVENDLSIAYNGTVIAVSINGKLAFNIAADNPYSVGAMPATTGLSGTGIGYCVMMDSSENFPSVAMDARFKQY